MFLVSRSRKNNHFDSLSLVKNMWLNTNQTNVFISNATSSLSVSLCHSLSLCRSHPTLILIECCVGSLFDVFRFFFSCSFLFTLVHYFIYFIHPYTDRHNALFDLNFSFIHTALGSHTHLSFSWNVCFSGFIKKKCTLAAHPLTIAALTFNLSQFPKSKKRSQIYKCQTTAPKCNELKT